jgi:hypothetical protein
VYSKRSILDMDLFGRLCRNLGLGKHVCQSLSGISDTMVMPYQHHIPSIGVVIGSNGRRFCFRRRRFSCRSSESIAELLETSARTSLERFSEVGKECTRPEESKFRAKDPSERMDTFMKRVSRIGPAAVGQRTTVKELCHVGILNKSSLRDVGGF